MFVRTLTASAATVAAAVLLTIGTAAAAPVGTAAGSFDPQTGSTDLADPDGTADSGSSANALCAVLSMSGSNPYFCNSSHEGDGVSALG